MLSHKNSNSILASSIFLRIPEIHATNYPLYFQRFNLFSKIVFRLALDISQDFFFVDSVLHQYFPGAQHTALNVMRLALGKFRPKKQLSIEVTIEK